MSQENAKQAAGYLAAEHCLRPGMKVGMGTGSTAIHTAIRTVQLIAEGRLDGIKIVATSFQTQVYLEDQGVRVYSMNDREIGGRLDVTIDGADEVDPEFRLIKGGGAAQLREKIAAYNSTDFYVVADSSKLVEKLGQGFPVPVEVVPEARASVIARLAALGLAAELRMAKRKAGPVVTDNGGLVLDIHFPGGIEAATGKSIAEFESILDAIPGATANGIFTRPVAGVFVGREDGRAELLRN